MKKEYCEISIRVLFLTQAKVLLSTSAESDHDGYEDDFIE